MVVGTDQDTGAPTTTLVIDPPQVFVFEFRRFTANQTVSIHEMTEGLAHHQSALNILTVNQWLANIYFRPFLRGAIAAEERDLGRQRLINQLRATIRAEWAARGRTLSEREMNGMVRMRSRGAHASHDADAISGGDIDKFDSLERGAVNSYIGSNWGRFRPVLEAYAHRLRQLYEPRDRDKIKMNFRLRISFLN